MIELSFGKKTLVMLAFVAAMLVMAAFSMRLTNPQVATPGVHIRSDGSIDPASVPIQRNGDTYVFTGDVYTQGISIEKEGVTIDGAGHTLMGPYNGSQTLWIIGEGPNQTPTNETFSMGIDVVADFVGGLTIRNLNIKNFSIGMYLWSANNTVIGNAITDGIVGVLLQGDGNAVTENYIANNKNGVFFGSTHAGNIPSNVTLVENCFVDNIKQLGGCVCIDYNTTEPKHTWDNGKRGNFWSDYNGTDANGDGIGDTPYVIDVLNEDRFPLMQSPAVPPTPTPTASPIPALAPITEVHIAVAAAVIVVVVVVAATVSRRRKRTETPDIM